MVTLDLCMSQDEDSMLAAPTHAPEMRLEIFVTFMIGFGSALSAFAIDPEMQEILRKIYKTEHDTAVLRLQDKITYDEAEELVLAIGITGNEADIPLLEGVFENAKRWGIWRVRIESACNAALARLGDDKALERIKAVLAEPIPARIPQDLVGRLLVAMEEAGFSQNPTFIPFLTKHLSDVLVEEPLSDVPPPNPARTARIALYEIVNRRSLCFDHRDVDVEKVEAWWAANKSQFTK